MKVSTRQLLLGRQSFHDFVRNVRQCELLVALHSYVPREVEIGCLVVDFLPRGFTFSNFVLSAEIKRENPLVIDLHEDRVGTLVTDLFAERQT